MEYRIRKQYTKYMPEYNRKTLYGVDKWFNISEYNGHFSETECDTIEEAKELIKKFHEKNIKNTKDDESSVVENFIL